MGIIEKSLQNLKFDSTQTFENMQVTPLLLNTMKIKDYLILDEAINEKVARIVEVSDDGNVPELKFDNSSDSAILLVDGEELIGAKQNRIVNLTILVGPKRTITIPVSCVEAGRWHHQTDEFTPSDSAMYSKVRAEKSHQVTHSMKFDGHRRSDQSEVWDNISEKMDCMASQSDSSAMSQIYNDNKQSLDNYVGAFKFKEQQCGAIFSINGEIKGLELFDNDLSCKLLMKKLIRSYALDAIEAAQQLQQTDTDSTIRHEDIRAFVDSIGVAATKEFPGTDLGIDIRFDTEDLAGGALLYEQKLIHLCVFPVTKKPEDGGGLFETLIHRNGH